MSDTPRTDEAILRYRYHEKRGDWHGSDHFDYVEPEFARELEREVAQARRDALEEAAKVCDGLTHPGPTTDWAIACQNMAKAECAETIRALINAAPAAATEESPRTVGPRPSQVAPAKPPAVPDVIPELPPYPDMFGLPPLIRTSDYDALRAVAEQLRAGLVKAQDENEFLRNALNFGVRPDVYKLMTQRAERAEQDLAACRELLSMHNMGGMTDYNDGPMKRALKAEAECERLRKDAERLDWCERQWCDGLHIESCGVSRGGNAEPTKLSMVYVGAKSYRPETSIRAAIDDAAKGRT